MANVFADNGYLTGMFGKWHLGDNYPYRPQDRGFQTVVAHKGGGVGQTPDFWGNRYFDDTYFHNGRPVAHEGYCTDIWFDEAMKFIETNAKGTAPFFCYLATNAPHSPYLVAERYRKLYEGNKDIPEPAFYGMITNIDENFGRLRKKLAELGIEDDTILIFMTDNGSCGGSELDKQGFVTRGYNAGMRGKKAWYYDGGHRVPFFVRWPVGGLSAARDIGEMALDVDLLPTFIDLCGLKAPEKVRFDGTSVAPLLRGQAVALPGDRVHFLQFRQNTEAPEKWTNAVMTRRWRLVGGKELYDIKADPGQRHDVASEHPDVVQRLRDEHEKWWAQIEPGFEKYCPIALGNDAENPTQLNAMDVMGDVAWHQTMIVQAQKSTGRWTVEVERPGTYRFSLRRWPAELALPIDAGVSPDEAKRHIYAAEDGRCGTFSPRKATLNIFDQEASAPVAPGDKEVAFTLSIVKTGVTTLDAWFIDAGEEARGAYYVTVERLADK
jgi:arylsulfatase A-like enzyme